MPWRSSRSRRCWPWHSWSLPHCERHEEDHRIPVPNWLVLVYYTCRYPMRNGDFSGLQWWFSWDFYMSIHIRITICKNPLNWDLNSHQGYEPVKIRGMIKKKRALFGTKSRQRFVRHRVFDMHLICICGCTQTHQICTCTYMLLHVDVNIDMTFGKQKDSSNLTVWGVTFVGRHAREPHDQGKLQRQNGASMPTLRGDTLWLRPFCGSHDVQVSPRLLALLLPFLKH